MYALSFASCIAFILISKSFAIDEPICSKFDYEEKLLAKMIRMEIEMERMKLDIETTIETRIDQAIENLTLTVTPPMVAFSAYNPDKLSYVEDEVVVFESVLFNEGSSYNIFTGVFTAQFKGLYNFNLHFCNKHQLGVHLAIVHNDVRVEASAQYDDAISSCGSVSSLLKVNVGDTVNVATTYTSNLYESSKRRASFMGFLVHAFDFP